MARPIALQVSCPSTALLRRSVTGSVLVGALLFTNVSAGVCVAADAVPIDPDEPEVGQDIDTLPLATVSDFSYIGGFTLPGGTYGESEMNYAQGVIEKSGNSLFIVGHRHHNAVAEFIVPELVNSRNMNDLNSAGEPVQGFSRVLNRPAGGNQQSLDTITGMEVINGQLVINAIEYYDAPANNTQTTVVVENAGSIASSTVKGPFKLAGAARSAGWMTQLPADWQSRLGGTHLSGHSSGSPIIGRHSVGPSARAVNGTDFLSASAAAPDISGTRLLEFSLENPLNADLYNESLSNDIWTHTTSAAFGFIVPGTRTYATFGFISGHTSGLGYKITQDNGNVCPGPCARVATDASNYYWLWDMKDLVRVMQGELESHAVQPYAYGEFDVPFQTSADGSGNPIVGGSYDEDEEVLYFTVKDANNISGPYSNPPVVAAYRVTSFP